MASWERSWPHTTPKHQLFRPLLTEKPSTPVLVQRTQHLHLSFHLLCGYWSRSGKEGGPTSGPFSFARRGSTDDDKEGCCWRCNVDDYNHGTDKPECQGLSTLSKLQDLPRTHPQPFQSLSDLAPPTWGNAWWNLYSKPWQFQYKCTVCIPQLVIDFFPGHSLSQVKEDAVSGNVVELEGNQPLQFVKMWFKEISSLTWEGRRALLQGLIRARVRRRSFAPWPTSREMCRCARSHTAALTSTCPPPTSARWNPGSSAFRKLNQVVSKDSNLRSKKSRHKLSYSRAKFWWSWDGEIQPKQHLLHQFLWEKIEHKKWTLCKLS